MHKQIPSSVAIGIIILLTGAVLTFFYIKSADLRYQTSHTLINVAAKMRDYLTPGIFGSRRFSTNSELGTKYADIINDAGEKDRVLIIEPDASPETSETPSTSTRDEFILPTELEGFKPSPESEWVKLYLQRLGVTLESLELEISYVRQWQQTGGLTRDLVPGSKGTDVKLSQYLLHKLAPTFGITFDRSSITGTYGPKTKSAIIALQKKLHINPDGLFNNEMRFFFDSLYFKDLCPDADVEQDKSYENVNRRISVPKDYIPSDLIRLPRTIRTVGVMCLSREPARRLEEMFNAAAREGHDLATISAYRSAHTQALLTSYYGRTQNEEELRSVAESGHSEHQLGTTVDLSGKSINYGGPSTAFGQAPEGKWLADNSYKFGFILSYPEGRQQDTGYIYEPWHFRYIGVDIAKDIFEEKMTIQEYLDLVNAYDVEE